MNPDRTITTERREWVVKAYERGATQAAMYKALSLAINSYRAHHKIPNGTAIFDDVVRVEPRDDEIVVFYEIEVKS
jgi:hypothetical protein